LLEALAAIAQTNGVVTVITFELAVVAALALEATTW
jgi:hypothetical protein